MRVGVIGVGVAGSSHLFDLASDARFRIEAVCARRLHRATDAAARFGAPRAYDNAATMIRDVDLDAVVLATPPDIIAAVLRPALAAGLAILIDKPAAVDAATLVNLAAGAHTTVTYNRRYQTHVHRARQLITDGALGPITAVRCTWSAPFDRRYSSPETYRQHVGWGNGVVLDTASHIIDTLIYLGVTPLAVDKARLVPNDNGADVAAAITLRWTGPHIPVSVRIQNQDDEQDEWNIAIHGRSGHLNLTRKQLTATCWNQHMSVAATDARRPVEDLLDITNGRRGHGATWEEAIAVLEVIDQIRQRATVRRVWIRPRAKALGRLNGAC
ncbi:Gfo/Idh/MocA family oxidoreductase [Micromonospora sp. WMMD1082]|uniref:Gfo/Idh/MocA family protein n=1 Tax=Micromonospora sp. WMMD1082 TaxID=3016104 RepID=UPI002417CD95|nr:Gfo/Idh/MocA family oxidoreductase [Micromonospora sp. WMMD1082]MDG4795493.1 Gfo/Idh/MocA family oxidoreductase [Micromonospora sp. WMMD1082]